MSMLTCLGGAGKATAAVLSRMDLRPLAARAKGSRPPRASYATRADLSKGDLVQIVAEKANLTKDQSRAAVDGLLDTLVNAVAKGRRFAQNFCIFLGYLNAVPRPPAPSGTRPAPPPPQPAVLRPPGARS
jgi:hypothetical protein